MITSHPVIQRRVAEHRFPLLFATISGAHLYGFASPDSDFDIRGSHILPLEQIVGLKKGPETIEQSGWDDGFEIDLVTHEIGKFFTLVTRRNGYVLEQIFSPLVVATTPEHDELKSIARRCVTKHHVHHYLGFAHTQWGLFVKVETPRVKPLLYVYRVLLTGIHLMKTGEIQANLPHLIEEFPNEKFLTDLIALKVAGAEKEPLRAADKDFHERNFLKLIAELKEASDRSRLPELPEGRDDLHDLLVRIRLRNNGHHSRAVAGTTE